MVPMSASEDEVMEADVKDVPVTFDESVVLLDVREDDEWQRGHAPAAVLGENASAGRWSAPAG